MKDSLDNHVAAYQGGNLYDFDNEILLAWYPRRVVMHSKGARSVLELGLGHGYATDIFSRNFARQVALEGSPAVIDNFHKKFPECKAQIIETRFESFSTSDKFDVIVMGFVLEHVDDPFGIISRYKHFLAPGAKMFIAVPNAEVLNRRLGYLAGILGEMGEMSQNDRLLGHKRYYTVDTLTEVINRAGCTVERMEGIYLKPFTTSQIVSLGLDKKIIQALCEVGVGYPELSCGILAQISVGR